jgi:3-phosphoshikimate 1-carboxyvinyltransferase
MTSANNLWHAPFRGKKPVDVRVVIPGSKSVTNRALILAAQAEGTSKLRRPLVSRDSELMMGGLKALGLSKCRNCNAFLTAACSPCRWRNLI